MSLPRTITVMTLAVGISAFGCKQTHRPPPSIVLVSLDTLRADHLGCYGYTRDTSPNLDRFAAEAVRFNDVSAQATGTLPSHLSLLSSLYPPQFRITRDDGANGDQMRTNLRLSTEVVTLAEVLRAHGYETVAFTDGAFVSARFGLAQGFDLFDEQPREAQGLRHTIRKLEIFLNKRTDTTDQPPPLFLFLHTYDIHAPYRAPAPFEKWYSRGTYEDLERELGFAPEPALLSENRSSLSEAHVEEIRALYDNGIRATDAAVGELFALLRSQSLYDDAVVVVLSDHGEEFLEHGDFNHGRTVYQELVRVPLLVRLPGQGSGGRVVDVPANLIDVAPTLLGVAGLPAQSQFQGSALIDGASMTKLRSQTDDSPIYFESPNVTRGVHGLRIGAYKLIKNGPRGPHELVRLDTDRAERIDLADQLPEIHDSMDARLTQWTRDLEQEGAKNGWMSVTSTEGPQKADIEALQALGYLD